jgi:hypothetical protein
MSPKNVWSRNCKGRACLRDLGVHGRVIFKWILEKYDMMVVSGLKWLRIGVSGRLFNQYSNAKRRATLC